MINFVDKYHVPKLNQDHVNHLKSPIHTKEIEAFRRSLPITKIQGPDGYSVELYQTFKAVLLLKLFTIFPKIETEQTYEVTVILIPK